LEFFLNFVSNLGLFSFFGSEWDDRTLLLIIDLRLRCWLFVLLCPELVASVINFTFFYYTAAPVLLFTKCLPFELYDSDLDEY
jgi:hypothetical protein